MDSDSRLVRITNCLQTILELEPELRKLEFGHTLLDEFEVLKNFLERIDEVELSESDVDRIERATANFLEELREPLAQIAATAGPGHRLQ
ncbi:hypothetical protein M7784_11200 [Desulfovibrio aminophilus]|nr:hypothetical protein [Desulfovibrio aminophilus]